MLVGRKIGQYNQKRASPGVASLSLSGSAPSISITPWAYTQLFLNHFDGADQSSIDIDEVAGVTWTHKLNGLAELDTAVKKFGTASCRITDVSGTGSYIHTNVISGFTSTDDWTLQGWIYITGSNPGVALTEYDGGSLSGANFQANITTSSFIINSQTAGSPPTITADTWFHWAIVNETGAPSISLYFDGNRIVQDTGSGAFDDFAFFTNATTGNDLWLDDLSLVDIVLYSGSTYTIPTGPS